MVDCTKCIHLNEVSPFCKDTYCQHCIHHAKKFMVDHYNEGPIGGKAHKNCDGCSRGMRVVNGNHVNDDGRPEMRCTADRYAAQTEGGG